MRVPKMYNEGDTTVLSETTVLSCHASSNDDGCSESGCNEDEDGDESSRKGEEER